MNPKILYILLAGCCCLLFSCKDTPPPTFDTPLSTSEGLAAQTAQFDKGVVQVTENVYVAIGYGLANSIMIEGEDSLIIVDVMESMQAAAEVKAAFDSISSKPVKAIIYTHNHTDHIFGAATFAADYSPEVYAHELLPEYLDRIATVIRDIIEKRSYRMFGTYLADGAHVNCGIGRRLEWHGDDTLGVLRPTITFSDTLTTTIAGVDIQLFHAPGETEDQLFVWLPNEKVLLCGDNFYWTFPNLYTIRGTPYRDVNHWVSSLDKMRHKQPEFLVPSHTRPIVGKDSIYRVLTNYRDAIQYVHDQTVRGMNHGLTPDALVEVVHLPPHLSSLPYLQEYYGTVEWSVRSIYNGYLGPFDGNPSQLRRLSPREEAEKVAALAGGTEELIAQMEDAFMDKDYRWALMLNDHLLQLLPEAPEVRIIRVDILTALGEAEYNPNLRNYYLMSALELKGLKHKRLAEPSLELIHNVPLEAIFHALATRLNPQKSWDVNQVVLFQFPDTDEVFTVHVRRGVAEVQPGAHPNPDITITVQSYIWKEIAAKVRQPAMAFVKGEIEVDGGKIALLNFLKMFDRE